MGRGVRKKEGAVASIQDGYSDEERGVRLRRSCNCARIDSKGGGGNWGEKMVEGGPSRRHIVLSAASLAYSRKGIYRGRKQLLPREKRQGEKNNIGKKKGKNPKKDASNVPIFFRGKISPYLESPRPTNADLSQGKTNGKGGGGGTGINKEENTEIESARLPRSPLWNLLYQGNGLAKRGESLKTENPNEDARG